MRLELVLGVFDTIEAHLIFDLCPIAYSVSACEGGYFSRKVRNSISWKAFHYESMSGNVSPLIT